MTEGFARAVMSLAGQCLGTGRREWALAMQAEFEAAAEDGKPFAFAIGCLIVAWRELVKQGEGRLLLAKYVLALVLLIPMAALQFEQAIGFSIFPVTGGTHGMLASGARPNPYLIWSQCSAVPLLLMLWMLLGIAHLCLAWVLVEGDWPRTIKCGAMIGAATITLSLFTGVLMLDTSPLIMQVRELGIELAAIILAGQWHARLSRASPELSAQ